MKICINHEIIIPLTAILSPSPIGVSIKYVCPVCENIFERRVFVEKVEWPK